MKKQLVAPHASQVLQITVAETITSGQWDVFGTGNVVGVFLKAGVSGNNLPFAIGGQYKVTKEGGTGLAWTAGCKVYLDETNQRFTTTASGNTLAGIAIDAATATAVVGKIALTPQAS